MSLIDIFIHKLYLILFTGFFSFINEISRVTYLFHFIYDFLSVLIKNE